MYYTMQEERKRAANQVRAITKQEEPEPHETLAFFNDQFSLLEAEVAKALDTFSAAHPMGKWARQIIGVGGVLASGLVVHIENRDRQTMGQLWSYAGFDPKVEWKRGQKRPWNAKLKTLCWRTTNSFVYLKNHEKCFYGHQYVQRKQIEVERDQSGGNAEQARSVLAKRNIVDPKTKATYESGHLPDGHIDARARRWVTKLFLGHWFEESYRQRHGVEPPTIYSIAHQGHTHYIPSPVPSLATMDGPR
jgi:hypothetical protein